jgi:ribonuclease HII
MKARQPVPGFREESKLHGNGYRLIAGVDEAGRGALAGPVVAAAVILGRRRRSGWLKAVRDSKLLSPANRDRLYGLITENALSWGVGVVSHHFIDRHGIVPGTRLAMALAMENLDPSPEALLIDYLTLPAVTLPQKGIIDGDAVCVSIACASVIAKVTRDRLMIGLDNRYPGYRFGRHKGYGTAEHLDCLERLGPCSVHRRSFAPVQTCRSLL